MRVSDEVIWITKFERTGVMVMMMMMMMVMMSGLPLRVSDEVIWITKYERKLMTSPHAETARNSR